MSGTPITGEALPRRFYEGDAREVAPLLLGKLLRVGAAAGRIVEVEAYAGAEDPASHAYRGPTVRNQVMFGPPGHLYVYFSYGMHWCANVVCAPAGTASAVLLRALAPVTGIDAMRSRRPAARRERDLCNGPGKLCQALGITGGDGGADLVAGERVALLDDGVPAPSVPASGPRVGISRAAEAPWRWWIPGDEHVSRR